jgi:LPXTG-motif cell wall-anchored protein
MPGSSDPAVIQAEIEATRARLGRTVNEIGTRLDVRAHAREKAFVARDTVVETYRESPPLVVGGALALVGLVAGLVVWRRKRATRRRKR